MFRLTWPFGSEILCFHGLSYLSRLNRSHYGQTLFVPFHPAERVDPFP
jgi:hypothetical protein